MSKRVMMQVFVDLDNVPGEFHTEVSARNVLECILKQQIGHYNPVVMAVAGPEEALQALDELEDYGEAFANEGSYGPAVNRTLADVEQLVATVKSAIVTP